MEVSQDDGAPSAARAASTPLVVRLAILTAFTPELRGWILAVPFNETLPFAEGLHPGQPPLQVNRALGVVGFSTGMGPYRTASSLMAFGHDPRFDLRFATFLVAGIAGVDPAYGSIGSVFLPTHLIGLGQDYDLDGIGHVVSGRRNTDTSPPYPSAEVARERNHLYVLEPATVAWAFALASSVQLPDVPSYQAARADYTEAPAQLPPRVVGGACASVSGETFWAGRESTQWARNWTRYWSAGGATLAVSDEEDLALATALSALTRAGRANASRLVVMRSASDYAYPPAGHEMATWFFGPTHMTGDSFGGLVLAGMPIVHALTSTPLDATRSPPPPAPSGGGECMEEASSAALAWLLLTGAIGTVLVLLAMLLAMRARSSPTIAVPRMRLAEERASV